MTDPTKAQPGDLLHVLATLVAFGDVLPRGAVVELTAQRIESTRDRLGRSWLDDLSEDAQLQRWGEVRVGLGPWPEDLPAWTYSSPDWQMARERASRAAWSHPDPATRAQALAEVEHLYGPARQTSQTIGGVVDPSGNRAAARQAELARAGGVRLRSSYAPTEREV